MRDRSVFEPYTCARAVAPSVKGGAFELKRRVPQFVGRFQAEQFLSWPTMQVRRRNDAINHGYRGCRSWER
jgi:hypothetical protein